MHIEYSKSEPQFRELLQFKKTVWNTILPGDIDTLMKVGGFERLRGYPEGRFFDEHTNFRGIELRYYFDSIDIDFDVIFAKGFLAEFPDAITTRGSKHLLTLIEAKKEGYSPYLLFLIQIQNMKLHYQLR